MVVDIDLPIIFVSRGKYRLTDMCLLFVVNLELPTFVSRRKHRLVDICLPVTRTSWIPTRTPIFVCCVLSFPTVSGFWGVVTGSPYRRVFIATGTYIVAQCLCFC